MRADVKLTAANKILTRHSDAEVLRNVSLTASTLNQGAEYIVDATLDDDPFSVIFDGLKKVDGPSSLGDFHYIPILFHGERLIRTEQRATLAVLGLLLSHVQPTKIVTPALSMDDEEDRIRVVFGLTRDDLLPNVDDGSHRKYYKYLAANPKFPFEGIWEREGGIRSASKEVTIPASFVLRTILIGLTNRMASFAKPGWIVAAN
jgi:hypothetical protein